MDYGETEEVQETHAAIQREKREPRAGLEPLSLWLIALYGLAVFFGGAYLGRYSGNFSGDGLDPLGGAPRAKKTAGGGEAATETVGAYASRTRQKDFLSQLRDLSSNDGARRGRTISAACRFRNREWRRAPPGHDCSQRFDRACDRQRSAIRLGGHAAVGKTLNDQKIADVLTLFVRNGEIQVDPFRKNASRHCARNWPAVPNRGTKPT